MSGFSPEWLALREPVDHRSRDGALAQALTQALAGRERLRVVDLGCGTGSNLRATSALLGRQQEWTLVDYDARLLAAARARLASWADRADSEGERLALTKGERRISVAFRQADLNRELESALGTAPDLVTASALFDLCSADFIAAFAGVVASRRAHFYTVLTYNGVQQWSPAHPEDQRMAAAFHAHQRTDKGFGASAGPDAPSALASAFRAAGYRVAEGDSPWRLGPAEGALVADLATGFGDAVAETGAVAPEALAAWRAVRRTGALVGHTDTLALPA